MKVVRVHGHVSDNKATLGDAENSWLLVDVDNREIRGVTMNEWLAGRFKGAMIGMGCLTF